MNLADTIRDLTADLKADNDRADRMVLVREAEDAIRAAVALNPTRFIKAIATDDWVDVGHMVEWAWKLQHSPSGYDHSQDELPEPRKQRSDEDEERDFFDRHCA